MKRVKAIDYLKTFAIIGVLLFHVGLVENGYLGVEVFFVISGFLMIGKVKKSIETNNYHPIQYILGRIATFWPLVAISGVIALLTGYFCMLPDDYENLAQSIIASDAFANNILQAITTKNYWDVVNTYKPLMHTWYVGVLVQSIIVISLLLWLTAKVSKKGIKTMMIIVTTLSFVAFCLPVFSASDKFYYFPFRLYEMMLGGLIVYLPESKLSVKARRLYGYIGIMLVLFVMFTGLKIPNYAGMIIVLLATCLVIWSHGSINEDYGISDRIYSFITLPGRYSYDVYIWHQVVIAFLYYSVFQELNILLVCLVIIITALLSLMSVNARRFIPVLTGSWKRITLSIIAVVVGCIPSIYLYLHAGVVRNIPELGIDVHNVHRHMHAEYVDTPYSWNKDFEKTDKIHVLVLGDSFGRDFANILNESQYADKLEISYIYGFDTSSEQDRVEQADFIFFGTNTWTLPRELESLPSEKLYIVGNKCFGNSNGIIYANRNKEWYLEQTVLLSEEMVLNNNALRDTYGDHYIDMLAPVTNNGSIKVFTDDGYYISEDCRHLTKQGAQFYARILNLDFLAR